MSTVRGGFYLESARPAQRGSPIRSQDAEATRKALRAITTSVKLQAAQTRSWAELMLHSVTVINDDYLECVRVWRGSTLGTDVVFVARPKRLRGSETARDGVTYVLTDPQTRTASKAGETDETQRVTPDYLVGDLIEVTISRGLTGVAQVDAQRGRPVDANVDGRAWAAEPAP